MCCCCWLESLCQQLFIYLFIYLWCR
jgi:hypothetical protein